MTARNFISTLPAQARRLRTLLASIVATITVAGLLGCAATTDEPLPGPDAGCNPPTEPDGQYISLLLNTATRAGARADIWGDDYESSDASVFENRIDPEKIHIFLYDSTGKPLGKVSSAPTEKRVKIYQFVNNPTLYQVVFDASETGIFQGGDYIAAIAVNIDNAFSPTGIDGVTFNEGTLTGKNPANGPDYYSGAMPMFGFLRWHMGTFDPLEGQLNGFPSVGTVHMLRSVAKIEVALSDDFDRYPNAEFMSFETNNPPRFGLAGQHLNALGYVGPASRYWMSKQTTIQLSFKESFYENTSQRIGNASANVPLHATSADGRMFYIYLPEASGAGMKPNESPLRLDVTINYNNPDDPEGPREINGTLFPSIPYDDTTGRPTEGSDYKNWCLTRNHIYHFTITDFTDETSLNYTVNETRSQTNTVPDFE